MAERVAVRYAGQPLTMRELPRQITARAQPAQSAGAGAPAAPALPDVLYDRMTRNGESFWTVVFAPFMSRDLTRETVRAVVRRGLECTKGNYRLMAPLFNFPSTDYKRFLNFLQKHDCHVPFQHFRLIARPGARPEREEETAAPGAKVG